MYIQRERADLYNNWELILVDDGAANKSSIIMDAAVKGDLRMRMIHQRSTGSGIARNCGIKEASGDYVVRFDSDDYIDLESKKLSIKSRGYNMMCVNPLTFCG